MMQFLGTWGPKIGGVLILVATLFQAIGAAIDGNPATTPNWEAVMSGLAMAGIGFTARANLVSSEAVGIKGPEAKASAVAVEAKVIAEAKK
jgi:hypothetical protein